MTGTKSHDLLSDTNKILEQEYYDLKLPGSYAGLERFYKELKNRKYQIDKETVKNWLKTQDTYTHHHPVKKHFVRNKVFVYGIDHIWQADLVDVSNLREYNDGFNYLLTCIDVFSKRAWAIPLKRKSGAAVAAAFEQIFKSSRKPIKIHTDKGTEFFNKDLQKVFKENNIALFNTNSEVKASIVERFNRTLKEKMYKYFTKNKSFNYNNMLQDLVSNYNMSYHRTIKTSPNKVSNKNEFKIWKQIYNIDQIQPIKFKFNVGDQVLISKNKGIFGKGYTRKWVREVFTIYKRIPKIPPVYKIKDRLDREIEGNFYEQELQHILKDKFEIEEILKTRIVNNKKQYFVSWVGYSKDFDSWITEEELLKHKDESLRNTTE